MSRLPESPVSLGERAGTEARPHRRRSRSQEQSPPLLLISEKMRERTFPAEKFLLTWSKLQMI